MSIETMSTTEALQEAPALLFTDAAARKVGDLIRGEGNPKLMLRVFVQGELRVALATDQVRSEEHTSELQSQSNIVCRLLLEKKKKHTVHGVSVYCDTSYVIV